MRPYISVVISAHNRKEFILNAVDSAINQTLDRSLYEIIVVKNYRNNEIDSYLKSKSCYNILCEDNRYGEKIRVASDVARGEVISFLDDDDLFLNDKLETVYNCFNKYDRLNYLHNGFVRIDKSGNILNPRHKSSLPGRKDGVNFIESGDKIVAKYYRSGIAANPSSIAIRKAVLESKIGYIGEINTCVDLSMFYTSLLAGGKLIGLRPPKTLYRVHDSDTHKNAPTFEQYYNVQKRVAQNFHHDLLIIYEMCKNSPIEEYAETQLSTARLFLALTDDAFSLNRPIMEYSSVLKRKFLHKRSRHLVLSAFHFASQISRGTIIRALYVLNPM